jgi:hypothetical protein
MIEKEYRCNVAPNDSLGIEFHEKREGNLIIGIKTEALCAYVSLTKVDALDLAKQIINTLCGTKGHTKKRLRCEIGRLSAENLQLEQFVRNINSLEHSELENTISVLKDTVKKRNQQIAELTQLNAALASTQLDAVNLLELEIERLKKIIDNKKKRKMIKIGDKIQNFMIGGYEYDECVIEFDEKLYSYVGVHRATGSQGLLFQHLDSLK